MAEPGGKTLILLVYLAPKGWRIAWDVWSITPAATEQWVPTHQSPACSLHLCKTEVKLTVHPYLCNNCWFKLWHIVYKHTWSTDPRCKNTAPSCFYPASIRGIPHDIWGSQVHPVPDDKAEMKKKCFTERKRLRHRSQHKRKHRNLPSENLVSASRVL